MTTETIMNLIMEYGPTILTVCMLVITTLSQKSNLFNGLKTLKAKAEEMKVAAEFKEVQDKMTSLMMIIQEQEKTIKELTNAIYRVDSKENKE